MSEAQCTKKVIRDDLKHYCAVEGELLNYAKIIVK